MKHSAESLIACATLSCVLALGLGGCAQQQQSSQAQRENAPSLSATDTPQQATSAAAGAESTSATAGEAASGSTAAGDMPASASAAADAATESTIATDGANAQAAPTDAASADASTAANAGEQAATPEPAAASMPAADAIRAALNISEDYRPSFEHGYKGPEFQKYIMLHDTEGESSPWNVVDYWDNSGNLVASHFVVGKDGSIVQCVPLDRIAHHAGYGDAGHNALYGVEDESRDDFLGTVPIGDWAPDYGMNSHSIGIEMVHVGGTGYYPEEQLQAVDALIAYIDAYYGFNSAIIDHKAWRSGNSDTSPEFAAYLANYQDHRTHL